MRLHLVPLPFPSTQFTPLTPATRHALKQVQFVNGTAGQAPTVEEVVDVAERRLTQIYTDKFSTLHILQRAGCLNVDVLRQCRRTAGLVVTDICTDGSRENQVFIPECAAEFIQFVEGNGRINVGREKSRLVSSMVEELGIVGWLHAVGLPENEIVHLCETCSRKAEMQHAAVMREVSTAARVQTAALHCPFIKTNGT